MTYTLLAYTDTHELMDLDVDDCARYGGALVGLSYAEMLIASDVRRAALVTDYETMAHRMEPVAYYLTFVGHQCTLITLHSLTVSIDDILAHRSTHISDCPPVRFPDREPYTTVSATPEVMYGDGGDTIVCQHGQLSKAEWQRGIQRDLCAQASIGYVRRDGADYEGFYCGAHMYVSINADGTAQ